MKVNNPTEWFKKPIYITSKEEYDKITIQLDKLGFKWCNGKKLQKYYPNHHKGSFYLYCYSNKDVAESDDFLAHSFNN